MIIELSGTSIRNKGAELMTAAICSRFHQKYPNVRFAVPQRFGTADERFRYGLWHKLSSSRYALNRKMPFPEKCALQFAERFIPKRLLSECGLVTNSNINAVIDASGFAFGDQLPVQRTLDYIEGLVPIHRRKIPIVLLPQAFGPFSSSAHGEAMKRLLDMSELVFARDDLSRQHLDRLSPKDDRIQVCPDLTLALETPGNGEGTPSPITLVPNSRMLDKIAPEDSQQYQESLVKVILHADQNKIPLQILLHDRNEDIQFVEILKRRVKMELRVVMDDDPIRLKSALATSRLVISSRFHALAGALSSGIPSIAIGWSHKYDQLMNNFKQTEWSLSSKQAAESIESCMDAILNPDRHLQITQVLNHQMTGIRNKIETMWQKVDQTIGLA